ncbi:tRNA 2-selenouridine(34) synthase MnmH [Undibacterium cyanobacteriorum]|uniref:tRNA 2-selenouridine(34) synthase MnmH n=1 Tax=Undibacterium cyanobacteriorum TaxID=3073561 RepID=A0ABY9RFV7_9BURK|nr:tRNA 2-selenouridine(34) synthase MnmH [Undibacterium sp. 20NA77.5]WMW79195.1 tRNA 2-selenouridine(34) synthase MnmH [Undibacterium sp. 20NA77.5]
MKYPHIISIAEVIAQLHVFDTIIDARSEAEFEEDHLPGAINCPVLNNEERIRVGTCYKQVGSFEAKRIGAALVARNIANHIEQSFHDKPREWRPLIYCWRGGNRSGSMATIFAKIGWPVAQLDGGYKEFRRHVNQALAELSSQFSWKVLCGPTGSCKSKLLQELLRGGAQTLDLEALAGHRGSVLGSLPEHRQASQKSFETAIWNSLRQFDKTKPVFVEAESKKIGELRVPELLMEYIRQGECVQIDLSMESRIEFLCDDYQHLADTPEQLTQQLSFLTSLHGHQQIKDWHRLIQQGELKTLVKELLEKHYDPAYTKSAVRNFKKLREARHFMLASHHIDDIAKIAEEIKVRFEADDAI